MARFEVTMTEEMAKRFQKVLVGKGTEFLSTLIAIDCAQSEAKEPEDKLRVFEVIERTIGFPLLNSMVVKVLERWVYSELLKTIKLSAESAIAGVQKSLFDIMESLCRKCLDDRRKNLGCEHSDTKMTEHALGCILKAKYNSEYLVSLSSMGKDAITMEAQRAFKEAAHEEMKAKELDSVAKRKSNDEASLVEERKMLQEAEEKARRDSAVREAAYKCKVLVEQIESGSKNQKAIAAIELQGMASNPYGQFLMAQDRFLPRLVQLLQSDNPVVQVSVTRVFEGLAANEKNIPVIQQSGAIQLLVGMLHSNMQPTEPAVVETLQKLCRSQSIYDMVAAIGGKSVHLVLNPQVHYYIYIYIYI
jgi:hypothetical protein